MTVTCAVYGCSSTSKEKERNFYRFPKQEIRCRLWIKASGRTDLVNKTVENLNTSFFICDLHFLASDRYVKKLKPCAIPTQNLPQDILVQTQCTQTEYSIPERKTTKEEAAQTDGLYSGSKAKDTWRTLRDGYIRYRKATEGLSDTSRKYSHYTWSSQMAFLEGTINLNLRAAGGGGDDVKVKREGVDPTRSPSLESGESASSPPPLSPQALSTLLQQSQSPGEPHAHLPPSAPKRKLYEIEVDGQAPAPDHADLDYGSRTRDWDSVDYLFMSYAKTFKKLSVRRQIKLKVELAKLFAEAELEEAENNPAIT